MVTQDAIQYDPDRNFPLKGTEQYAYDGETFEDPPGNISPYLCWSRRSEVVHDSSDDPRFWGWNLRGGESSLVMFIDGLDIESIKEVRFNDSEVYHIRGKYVWWHYRIVAEPEEKLPPRTL